MIAAPRPFLKWAGGKGRLLAALERGLPETFATYHEPFLGGGALFFHLAGARRLRRARLSDVNEPLVETFRAVRADVDAVIGRLRRHARRHCRDHYYAVRDAGDRGPAAARAARLIYLNRTCYNGLYRENRAGRFNVPMGRYRNPRICDPPGLRSASRALQVAAISRRHFSEVLGAVRAGDLVYLDPPYQPLSPTSSFTSYDRRGFSGEDQEALASVFRKLAAGGVHVMLSNSDTPRIRELYRGFPAERVRASRAINSRAQRRGPVRELIVRSWRPQRRGGGP